MDFLFTDGYSCVTELFTKKVPCWFVNFNLLIAALIRCEGLVRRSVHLVAPFTWKKPLRISVLLAALSL